MKSRKKSAALFGAAAIVGAALVAPIAGAAPAEAATRCNSFRFTETWAAARCQGAGSMRFKVTCNAVWPFAPWTKYSGWIAVGSGSKDVTARFPDCGWTASVSGQYR
ncbi:MAG: hypothetical protein JWP75_1888 [Frondihabitans sp.]|nr:hypothetical protein [Frondihabitans sp.]